MKMKHANYARTRATTAKGGQTTFLTRWGLTAPLEFHKPIKPFHNESDHLGSVNHRASCKIKKSQAPNLFPERFCKGKTCFCLIDFLSELSLCELYLQSELCYCAIFSLLLSHISIYIRVTLYSNYT